MLGRRTRRYRQRNTDRGEPRSRLRPPPLLSRRPRFRVVVVPAGDDVGGGVAVAAVVPVRKNQAPPSRVWRRPSTAPLCSKWRRRPPTNGAGERRLRSSRPPRTTRGRATGTNRWTLAAPATAAAIAAATSSVTLTTNIIAAAGAAVRELRLGIPSAFAATADPDQDAPSG